MNKKLFIITASAVIVIIAAVILFSVFGSSSDTPTVNLPDPTDESSGSAGSLLTVTPENVQVVLSNITATGEYSREYNVTTFWSEGNSTADVKVWKDGDKMRISHKQDDVTKNIIFSDGMVYIWYGDSDKVFSASLSEYETSNLDLYARLVSLQEIMDVPAEQITDAGYVEKLGENCIYAEYTVDDESNYVNRIYVSVDTGLLVAAEMTQNDKMTYSMSSIITTVSAPDDDIFTPPST